jgi:hypothetical protein
MVPPDGVRTKRIPTLSWESVVGSSDAETADAESAPAPVAAAAPAPVAAAAPAADSIVFEPLRLDAQPASTVTAAPVAAPPDAPAATPAPPAAATPVPTVVPAPAPEVPVAPVIDDAPPVDDLTTVRTTPPSVIVPAIGDVTSGPESVAPVPAPVADTLPEIQEATPVVDRAGPMLPSMPAQVQRPATAAASFDFDPASVGVAPTTQPRRRKKRGGLKLIATVVALGGVVAGGFVFGQTYLAPSDWDDATAPYSEAVESARGVDFAEPLSIVAEPTATFSTRLQTQLAPVSPEELARWRALGLSSGSVDDATLAAQLAGWQDALYSTVDGQVYHDLGVAGPELDAQLVQAMAAASLDQELGWSVEQSQRALDAAAATSAEVLRQARAAQQLTEFSAPVPAVPTDTAAALPPVIGYQVLAPYVFAEFDATIDPAERTNPLAGLGAGGPGLLGAEVPILATGPTMVDGDSATTSPVAKDRSFWYLVFASYLDQRAAHEASEAIVESALTGAVRGSTECAYATFSGGGVDQTNALRSALTAWTAAAPPEMASSFLALPDGTLQLASCDPGADFVSGARPDVARELLSWRMAELATMEAVRVGGGGATELVDAWAFVQASPVAVDLMALPPTATPAEMATAAKDAVNGLFTPAG